MKSSHVFKSLRDVEEFLRSQMPHSGGNKFPGQFGLNRTKFLLKLLGNPQEKLKIIHVAGTSGKGSTAYFTSLLLSHSGFKVGLALSPHVVDIRERFQINNSFLSEKVIVDYLNTFLPYFYKVANSDLGAPTYYEIIQIVAFVIFAKEKVDYAVIETGIGGLFDSTNVIDRPDKVCVITKIGLDHTKILGPTTKEIAMQKAGIIHAGNVVFTVDQRPEVLSVLIRSCKQNHTDLVKVKSGYNYSNNGIADGGITFDFKFNEIGLKKLFVSTHALYQVQNIALALCVFIYVCKRERFTFDTDTVRDALKKAYFVGRFDKKKVGGKTLIIDGAHNPQKMRAFLSSLAKFLPNQKYDFVIPFKKGSYYKKMLDQITPFAEKRYVVTPENSSAKCLEEALNASGNRAVIVTGSLYLCGDVIRILRKLREPDTIRFTHIDHAFWITSGRWR